MSELATTIVGSHTGPGRGRPPRDCRCALVAIPIAAALQLLTQEVLYPRLDEV
jgi:hypothetical protein